jgi:hypothetical protein
MSKVKRSDEKEEKYKRERRKGNERHDMSSRVE